MAAALRPFSFRKWSTLRQKLLHTEVSTTLPESLPEPKQEDVLSHPDFFRVSELFSVKQLFDARVHWGHTVGTLNPHMKQFLFGARLGQCIFDLDKTSSYLKRALNFTAHIAYREGVILFVSRNPQYCLLVENTAKECQEYAHTRTWIQGTFTDSSKVFGRVTRLPDLVIALNTLDTVLEDHPAITESAKLLIPTVAIVDSNCNPVLVTYPVPGNDDSEPSVQLYCSLFKQAILKGKEARKLKTST